MDHARYVLQYLKGTKDLGVTFSSSSDQHVESFVKFPLPSTVLPLCNANWGPQDQSKPSTSNPPQLDLFKSRLVSGFLLWLLGPLHWVSKRQTITARSSAKAGIYATDECVKCLLHLTQLIDGVELTDQLMPAPTTIYNNNAACVQWTVNMTTKGLRHIQIWENAIRELVQNAFVQVQHINGKNNLSDMFTKEDKDVGHFLNIRNLVLSSPPNSS